MSGSCTVHKEGEGKTVYEYHIIMTLIPLEFSHCFTIKNKRCVLTNIVWYHLYVECKIWHKWTHPRNRNRLTDIENRIGLGVWDKQTQTIICRMDKQQGPTVQHRELYSISYNTPQWKRLWKRRYIYTYLNNFAIQQKLTTILQENKFKKKDVSWN